MPPTPLLTPEVVKDFDPAQPRDDHGRWSKIGEALHEIGKLWSDAAPVQRHEVFGGPEGSSDSHGIIAYHGDDEFSLNLHDKDAGTSGAMWLHSDELGDLEYDLQRALDDDEPGTSGEFASDRWKITYDDDGIVLHANIDDDDALEEVYLSRDDAESLIRASELSRTPLDRDDPSYTPPLAAGETTRERSRKRLGDPDQEFIGAMAVVDTSDGPRVRLGAISHGQDGGIKDWTGGRGQTTVSLDEADAMRVAAVLERFEAEGKRRQKIYDQYVKAAEAREAAGEDFDWDEEVSLPVIRELHGDFEDDFGEEVIETPWGFVRLTDVGMDDEANAFKRHIRLEIWPKGMTEAQYDAGQEPAGGPKWAWPTSAQRWQKPDAKLFPKDVRTLTRTLGGAFESADVAKMAVGAWEDPDQADDPADRVEQLTDWHADWQNGDYDDGEDDADEPDGDADDVLKLAGHGGKTWEQQWKPGGKLAKKWVGKRHPFRALRNHLRHHMPEDEANRIAAQWHKDVFGIWPGEKRGKNPVGPG